MKQFTLIGKPFHAPLDADEWDDIPPPKPWLDPTDDDLWDANGEPLVAPKRRDWIAPLTKAAKIAFVALSLSLAFTVGANVREDRPRCWEDEVVFANFGEPLACVHIDVLQEVITN